MNGIKPDGNYIYGWTFRNRSVDHVSKLFFTWCFKASARNYSFETKILIYLKTIGINSICTYLLSKLIGFKIKCENDKT